MVREELENNLSDKCRNCKYIFPHIECLNCGENYVHFIDKNKIELTDISWLMHSCIENGYAFTIKKSLSLNIYNIYVSFFNKNHKYKKSFLLYYEDEGLIRHYIDESHTYKEFNSIDRIMDLLYDDLEE